MYATTVAAELKTRIVWQPYPCGADWHLMVKRDGEWECHGSYEERIDAFEDELMVRWEAGLVPAA